MFVVGSSVTFVLGHFVLRWHVSVLYPGDHCRIGVLSVATVTVVMDSACGTNTVLCCMWESLIN